jgi:hypothetical protein
MKGTDYDTKILVFMADFKDNFCVSPMVGFSPKRFVGTRKEWDIKVKPWYDSESRGKIIGVFTAEFTEVKSGYSEMLKFADSEYLKMQAKALKNESDYKLNNLSNGSR